MADLYIWIPRWRGKDGFQHYSTRDPIWIKNYTRLLSSDAYRSLSFAQRGLLHGIWLEYARSSSELPADTLGLSRRIGQQVMRKTLDSLAEAGFIEVIASTVLAARLQDASLEKKRAEADGERSPSSVSDLLPSSNESPLPDGDIDFSENGRPQDADRVRHVLEEGGISL